MCETEINHYDNIFYKIKLRWKKCDPVSWYGMINYFS